MSKLLVSFVKSKEGRNLSKSAYKILEIMEKKDNVSSASEIISELNMSTRAIHYSLHRLVERNILERRPYLEDMRQSRYRVSETILVQMRMQFK